MGFELCLAWQVISNYIWPVISAFAFGVSVQIAFL